MNIIKSKWFKWSLGLFVIVLIASFFINRVVKSKIENYLAHELPAHIVQTHDQIQLHILRGDVAIINPKVSILDTITGKSKLDFEVELLAIENFKLFKFLLNKDIVINEIKAVKPFIKTYKQEKIQKDSLTIKKKKPFNEKLVLKRLIIENAKLELLDTTNSKDSLNGIVENLNVKINNLKLDSLSLKESIPFKYETLSVTSDSLFMSLGLYENLSANSVEFDGDNLNLNDLKMQTKYSQKDLSKIITKERDHFNIHINEVNVSSIVFGRRDSLSFIETPRIEFNSPTIHVFRDKLVKDDESIKKMYGTMLREMPIQLKVDSLLLKDGLLEYSERVHPDGPPGKIILTDFNAQITNISNTYESPEKTNIAINTRFMNQAEFDFNWEFDVNSHTDAFNMHGDIRNLDASSLDVFTEPNLGVKLLGKFNKTEFYINGNSTKSEVDFRLNYDDFEVNVLKPDHKKNKFFSGIANVLVRKDSKSKKSNVVRKKSYVTRNQTKSVFNFLWLNVKEGLVDVIVGEKLFEKKPQ